VGVVSRNVVGLTSTDDSFFLVSDDRRLPRRISYTESEISTRDYIIIGMEYCRGVGGDADQSGLRGFHTDPTRKLRGAGFLDVFLPIPIRESDARCCVYRYSTYLYRGLWVLAGNTPSESRGLRMDWSRVKLNTSLQFAQISKIDFMPLRLQGPESVCVGGIACRALSSQFATTPSTPWAQQLTLPPPYRLTRGRRLAGVSSSRPSNAAAVAAAFSDFSAVAAGSDAAAVVDVSRAHGAVSAFSRATGGGSPPRPGPRSSQVVLVDL